MKLKELLRKLGLLQAKAKSIFDGMEGETLTEAEQKEWDSTMKEIEGLQNTIKALKKNEELEAEAARFAPAMDSPSASEIEEKKKIIKRYSFSDIIKSGGNVSEGLAKEMHEEARKEARASGIILEGVGVPGFFMKIGNQRDLTVGTEGTDVVQTDVMPSIIPALEPKLVGETLGVNIMTGLQGDIKYPRDSSVIEGTWEGETDENAEETPTLNNVSLTPNRLGLTVDVAKQMLFQSKPNSEAFVRRKLERAIKISVDKTMIQGNGGAITGIIGTAGIGSVVGGTDGAVPTHANIVALETAVAVDNALMGNLHYLTTPQIRGLLKTTKIDAGSGLFIWPNSGSELNSYNALASTQVPSTLTKGSSSGICHAIIFGDFSKVIIANWAGIDLIINPFTKSKNALVEFTVNSWWDIDMEHPESMAAMLDALLS
ncbi:phage major capsid protein [Chondrinema litorale]|uniref:phage major capsid protein n=1 Tax=Chondrinema litorale TaxID=2994555 RepID=UPI0025435759|nr:phage major capsid protein [Chondrinema litorale]UZS00261.1 phage major capsid protein [Chondrinema litorale]